MLDLVPGERNARLRRSEEIQSLASVHRNAPKRDRTAFRLKRRVLKLQRSVREGELATKCAVQKRPPTADNGVRQIPDVTERIQPGTPY
ncbi:MAG: hypothetical protein HY270_10305 [Deltaproteobacteria bacterium]|nr:hypothetical protein [Deltaproteobacteria bacterium]